jgi:small subunit ribosomal protein S20
MPQRKAGKKDLKQNAKRKKRNIAVKRQYKKAIKQFKKTLDANDQANSKEVLQTVYKTLDKAAQKNVIHAKRAARYKSKLTKNLNQASEK